jgi:hypothetical protein
LPDDADCSPIHPCYLSDGALTMHFVLGALTWDPQIRGFLIVISALLILPGSVYLLLATNTGPRVGFLLALAGLTGWIAIMGTVWMIFGIGMIGRPASWKPRELVTGSLAGRSTVPAMQAFPGTWRHLPENNSIYGDASSAADRVFVPSAAAQPGKEAKPPTPEEQARFASPFTATSDYLVTAVYDKGGQNWFWKLHKHKFYFRHSPHYVVVQVRPVEPECKVGVVSTAAQPCQTPAAPGAPPNKPVPDPTKPITTLTMVRDLGSLRFPPFLVALSALLVFGVTCSVLHERDKEIMRARGQIPAAA